MGDGVACGSLARLSAYFSMRPPAVPVQLVPVSAPLNLPALPPRLSTSSPPSHTADLATHLNNVNIENIICTASITRIRILHLRLKTTPNGIN